MFPSNSDPPFLVFLKGSRNPADILPADTSTSLVLNALRAGADRPLCAALLERCHAVSTNHFDIDSFLSVWACINKDKALRHENGGMR
jgi:hypothetical protein